VDSIGEKLKSARLARKLTIKDVVKQTNINPVYLNALEDEEFEKFPSETYLIGFLRSYSEFLKLDVDEMIQSYRGYKIGESATPLEELTKSTRPPITTALSTMGSKYKNIIFAVLVAVFAVAAFWGVKNIISSQVDVTGGNSVVEIKDQYKEKKAGTKIENIRPLQLQNNKGFVLVYKNEAVQFLVEKKEVVFVLKEIKGDSVFIEFFPHNQLESIKMDLPSPLKIKGTPQEVLFTLKGLTENRAKILVQIESKKEKASEVVVKSEKTDNNSNNVDVIAQNRENLKIVFEAAFNQKSFIEIYLDGSLKKRGFIAGGSRERWEASEYIQVKIGNAGGINARINGKEYVFGKSGQVANKVIKWKRDAKNPNLYHIHVSDWN
jgi:cytoskeletal protein RodZ